MAVIATLTSVAAAHGRCASHRLDLPQQTRVWDGASDAPEESITSGSRLTTTLVARRTGHWPN